MTFLPRSLTLLLASTLLAGPVLSGSIAQPRARCAPDEILVTCRAGVEESRCLAAIGAAGLTQSRSFRFASDPQSKLNRVHLVRIHPGQELDEALESARSLPEVEAAQPNYAYRALQVPDDPYYYLQWGQDNQGGNPAHDEFGLPGPDPFLPDADMDIPEATALYEGWTIDPVIVAVVDTGIDLTHPDLAARIWTNPDEIPGDGADNDSNGYVDDVHGWDFVNGDNDPDDVDGHGTHVAGTIGAIRDNGIGIAGTAENAVLMPVQFLDAGGSGYTDDAIDAILYGAANGAMVINNSWGGESDDPLLEEAIEAAGSVGVLFVTAAGNEASDNDLLPVYPSSFDSDNIISVAASSPWGDRAAFSNWGIDSVDIAAPGDEIISTTPDLGEPGIPSDTYQISYWYSDFNAYVPWSGTSMASPAVAAAGALLFGLGNTLWPDSWSSMTPEQQMLAVRDRILNRTERWASFSGQTATDGHLNLYNLVEEDIHPPDPCGPPFELVARGTDVVTLRWVASGDDGSVGQANYYDLRYQAGDTIDFAVATRLTDVWTPGPPGAVESYTLAGLSPGSDYTFGLVVLDNVGNGSALAELTVTTLGPVDPPPLTIPFEDHFDGDDCGNWILEGAWGCESESLSDSPGDDYPVNHRASASLLPLDFAAARSVQVAFDLVACDFEPDYDFLFFQYSLDGMSWRTLGSYTGSTGGPQAYDLPMLAGLPEVWFRFLSLTDYAISHDGARIDDFTVTVTEPPGCVSDPDCDDLNVCTQDTCDVTGFCYSTPIPGCEDADADGIEDPNDNCPATPNAIYGGTCVSVVVGTPCIDPLDCFDGVDYGICSLAQEDLDSDGTGDACDPDQDGDGVEAAAGDCDDRNAMILPGAEEVCDGLDNDCDESIDNVPLPPVVDMVRVTLESLVWTPVDGASHYDAVRGDLIALRELGFEGTTAACMAENTAATEATLNAEPGPGEGHWYLARAVNCGGSGSYGVGNPPRSPSRDEAVSLSPDDCNPLP